MVIKLVAASVAGPAVLCVVFDHHSANVAVVLQLTVDVFNSTKVTLMITLVVDAFVSWVAHCCHIPGTKHN